MPDISGQHKKVEDPDKTRRSAGHALENSARCNATQNIPLRHSTENVTGRR
jgi:hypothetical protein